LETVFLWNCDPASVGAVAANPVTTIGYVIKAMGGDGHLLPIELTSNPVANFVAEPTGLGE
jgi:hypothetical protein